MANEVLGTITCDRCGETASVHQTKRGKGRYLYTNGCDCGCDQTKSAAQQTRLWTKTEWRNPLINGSPVDSEGEAVTVPPNVTTEKQPQTTSNGAVLAESRQKAEEPIVKKEPKPEPKPEPKKEAEKVADNEDAKPQENKGSGGLMWGLLSTVAIGALIALSRAG